jgi:hypothetical protein
MGRARNLLDTTIDVSMKIPSAIKIEPLVFNDFKKHVRVCGKDKYEFIEWLDSESGWTMDENLFNRLRVENSPDWMLNLLCSHQMETDVNNGVQFIPTFVKIARYKSWPCIFDSTVVESKIMSEIHKECGVLLTEDDEKRLSDIRLIGEEEIDRLSKKRSDDGHLKVSIHMAKCLSRFPPLQKVFELDWYKYYSRNALVFDRSTLLDISQLSLQSHDAMSVMYSNRNGIVETSQLWTAGSNIMMKTLSVLDITEDDFFKAEIVGEGKDDPDNFPICLETYECKWNELQLLNQQYNQAMCKNKGNKPKLYKEIKRGMISVVNGMLQDWGRELEAKKDNRKEFRNKRTYRVVLNKHFGALIGSFKPRKEPLRPTGLSSVLDDVREIHFKKRKQNEVTAIDRTRKKRK